ncbi:sulfate transporter family-domain-containing protein [Polychytrium aggregatum]|uniref:sulfate transporter family-domain-containing protein n=1 Tax=Polychytrium aggregatum TaxID=110093 RepID=UPI0022FF33DE|nr:sulfate transporter family-domain-containing protein [Polychytrium aggregatum]KAI9204235.1 sulfate transporter family-domain-containing protein [Polychytrium aggregatum]
MDDGPAPTTSIEIDDATSSSPAKSLKRVTSVHRPKSRSHYSSLSITENVLPAEFQHTESFVTASAKEVREQTVGWTLRELSMVLPEDNEPSEPAVATTSDRPSSAIYSPLRLSKQSFEGESQRPSQLSAMARTVLFKDEIDESVRHRPDLTIETSSSSLGVKSRSSPCQELEDDDDSIIQSEDHSFEFERRPLLTPSHQSGDFRRRRSFDEDYGEPSRWPLVEYWKHLKRNPPRREDFWMLVSSIGQALPAVVLGVILNLLDAMSYGIIIFPSGDKHIPESAPQSGISMYFASTVIAQLVYTFGGSAFKGVNGSMMIEVMPFLHIICKIIEGEMRGMDDHSILATIMITYSISTLLTGLIFLLIGVLKLGNIIQFFPRHILVGCIGGIGFFLIKTGIEVTTGVTSEHVLEYLHAIFQPHLLVLWASSLGLALFLKFLQRFIHHPLFVPTFYVVVPIVFYIFVWIFGLKLDDLRKARWLFDLPEGKQVPFYTFWTYFDLGAVHWSAIPGTFPTMLALTFFGILHVPINVPALAVSTHQEFDINHEIVGHGISNIVSSFFGTIQNYLVYSNSVLYIRSGGGSVIGGFLLAVGTSIVWFAGSAVISIVPTLVVGALIFHLGIDLMKESIIDTWNVGIHPLEYFTIITIVVTMGVFGFTEGIIVGIILACVFFVVMYSRKSVIRANYTGMELRSTVHRLYRQRQFLDNVGDQIHIIKLQGFMFFGTVNQLDAYICELIHEITRIRFVILDFSLINGMDYSAMESFLRIRRIFREYHTHLVFASLGAESTREVSKSGLFDTDENGESFVHNFETLNESLEWCENQLLQTFYRKSHARTSSKVDIPEKKKERDQTLSPVLSVRGRQAQLAASLALENQVQQHRYAGGKTSPISILMQAFSEVFEEADVDELISLTEYFEQIQIPKGHVLWHPNQDARELYVIESGTLLMVIGSEEAEHSKVVETLLAGSMVGELEMFSGQRRMYRLVADDDSVIWKLDKDTFDKLCDQHPRKMLIFITRIALAFDSVRLHNTLAHFARD